MAGPDAVTGSVTMTIPSIKITDVDGPRQWNPTLELLYDNPVQPSLPYRCLYHFDGGGQCSHFLTKTQRATAVAIIDELSRKDIREINKQDRLKLLRPLLCTSHSEGKYLTKELKRTKTALDAAILEYLGPYEEDWLALRQRLHFRHGNPDEQSTWIRYIALDILPTFTDLKTTLPWPVLSGDFRDVNPASVMGFYCQKLLMTIEWLTFESTKHGYANQFMLGEKKKWAPLREIFGAMKEVFCEGGGGWFLLVGELVDVVMGVVESIFGVLKGRDPFGELAMRVVEGRRGKKIGGC